MIENETDSILSSSTHYEVGQTIVQELKLAFEQHDYTRMLHYGRLADGITKLARINGELLPVVRQAIEWSFERLELGTTHAYAAAADWCNIYRASGGNLERQLLCILEALDHIAFDCARQPFSRFTDNIAAFSSERFLKAVDGKDENSAISMLRGAFQSGQTFKNLEPSLLHAALMHYTDYGHSLIYFYKSKSLAEILGPSSEAPLLFALTRFYCRGFREDMLPEFSRLGNLLVEGPDEKSDSPTKGPAPDFFRKSVDESIDLLLASWSSNVPADSLYQALASSCSRNFLYYDERFQQNTDHPPHENIGWLHFSHALTFGNALRRLCEKYPQFWKMGLLQLATFSGRVSAFLDLELDTQRWNVAAPEQWLDQMEDKVIDHGLSHPIFSCHRLKTYWAIREEFPHFSSETKRFSLLALNRFLHAGIREKYPLRTIKQAMAKSLTGPIAK